MAKTRKQIEIEAMAMAAQKPAQESVPEGQIALDKPRGGFMGTGESALGLAKGATEVAGTMLSGAASQVWQGLSGLGQGGFDFLTGQNKGKRLSAMVERIDGENFTYQPKSQIARTLLGIASAPFEPLMKGAGKAGEATLEATGSPGLAAAVDTGVQMSPSLIGAKNPVSGFIKRRSATGSVEKTAGDLGVDLNSPLATQREQIIDAARTATGNRVNKGSSMNDVQKAVQDAEVIAKQGVDDLYTAARKTQAGIPVEQTRIFGDTLHKSLETFIIEDMPKVTKLLSEVDRINKIPNGTVKLDAMEKWRQRIVRNRAPDGDRAQQAALNLMKKQYDEFRDAMFDSDMVSGDPTAVGKWKEATKAFSEYAKTFNDDRVIRDLVNKEATPEEMRKWLFNSSALGLKAESGRVIAKIKGIVGDDSPQMTALRQDALLDIMEPLLRENPNFGAFTKNYEKLVLKNKTLMDELLPESKTALQDVYKFAKAHDNVYIAPSDVLDWKKLGAVALFGHGIAVAGRKVAIATKALDLIVSYHTHTEKRQTMGQILGYDPYAPLMPIKTPAIGAGVQTLEGQNELQ